MPGAIADRDALRAAGRPCVRLINAAGIVFLGVPPIIMTLGTLGAYRGMMRVLTGGSWIESIPQTIKTLAVMRYLTVPVMVWAVVALVIVLGILLSRIKSVRNFYAVGDNREGAYLLGINVPADGVHRLRARRPISPALRPSSLPARSALFQCKPGRDRS